VAYQQILHQLIDDWLLNETCRRLIGGKMYFL
jgi:hypothetical protein